MANRNLVHIVQIVHASHPNYTTTTFRFASPGWWVIREDWQGSNLLNTRLLARFSTEEDAEEYRAQYKEDNKSWL